MADKCLFLQSRFVFSPRILFTYYYPITWTFSQASCFRCYIFPLATNYLQINYSSMIKFQPLISQLRVFTIRIRDGIGSEMDWRWLYPCGRSKSKNPNPNLIQIRTLCSFYLSCPRPIRIRQTYIPFVSDPIK